MSSYLQKLCLLLLCAHALCGDEISSKFRLPEASNVIQNQFIVTLSKGSGEEVVKEFSSRVAALEGVEFKRQHVVGNRRFLRVDGPPDAVRTLVDAPGVGWIEANREMSAPPPIESVPIPKSTLRSRTARSISSPDGTCHFDYPGADGWGIIRTSHQELPDYNSAPYIYGNQDDGHGVDIYIVDTGIRTTHIDYEGRASFGMIAQGLLDQDATDKNGHGSHVAGIAAGRRFGLARKANLIACKVLGGRVGLGSWDNSVEALAYIVNRVNEQKAAGKTTRSVVNMSLGGDAPIYFLETAIQETIDAGVLVSTSSGNIANDTCIQTPQRIASIMTVAASEYNDTLAYFSTYGPCVDIIAPGRLISGPDGGSDENYVKLSGTSMACPHAVGMAARVLSEMTDAEARATTPEKVKAKLIDMAAQGKVMFESLGQSATRNRLLYKRCSNPDFAETTTTTPFSSRATGNGQTTKTTATTPKTTTTTENIAVATKSSQWQNDDIGNIVTATLALTAGIVGVTFPLIAFVQIIIHKI